MHIYCKYWDASEAGLEIRYQFSLSLYSSKSGYIILFWPITLILLDRKLNLIKRFYFSFSLFIRGHCWWWWWWVADNKAQLRELKYLGVAKIRSVAIIVAKLSKSLNIWLVTYLKQFVSAIESEGYQVSISWDKQIPFDTRFSSAQIEPWDGN